MLTRLLLAITLVVGLGGVGRADPAREILDRRETLDNTTRHWDDRHARMSFVIVDRRGSERNRELELYERREAGDERKTIVFFQSPPEVKGTGFLAFTHHGSPADQWLYLPELKRVRQITAHSRNESFVGTDLSYHDLDLLNEMGAWTDADAAATLKGEEAVDGVPTHVIEYAPKREDIGYHRIVLWLGKDDLTPRRLEFWEDGDAPKKRIQQGDVRSVGPIPVAYHVEVESVGAGSKTTITLSDVQFDLKLEPDLFSQRYLERGSR
jgi:outer membrane lipoprotein-sorting protein